MEVSEFTPRATVSKEMWQNHIIKKLRQGFELTIWPRRASLTRTGLSTTPCQPASARKVAASGMLEPVGQSRDQQGIVYRLRPEFMGDAIPTPVISVHDLDDPSDDVDLDDSQMISDLTIQAALQQADQEPKPLS